MNFLFSVNCFDVVNALASNLTRISHVKGYSVSMYASDQNGQRAELLQGARIFKIYNSFRYDLTVFSLPLAVKIMVYFVFDYTVLSQC